MACHLCPETPIEGRPTPLPDLATAPRMTFPCGHAVHTSCWFLCEADDENPIPGFEHGGGCPVCNEGILTEAEVRWCQRNTRVNARTLWDTSEPFRNDVVSYFIDLKAYTESCRPILKQLKTHRLAFKERTVPTLELLRQQTKEAISAARKIPGLRKTTQRYKELERKSMQLKNLYRIKRTLLHSDLQGRPGIPRGDPGWFGTAVQIPDIPALFRTLAQSY